MIISFKNKLESLLKCSLLGYSANYEFIYEKDINKLITGCVKKIEYYDLDDLVLKHEAMYKKTNFLYNKEKMKKLFRFVNLARFHKKNNRFDLIIKTITQALGKNIDFVVSQISKESREVYEMSRQVLNEIHRMKAFARFSEKGKILFSNLNFEHNTQEIVLKYFMQKYPENAVIIADKTKTYIGYKDNLRVVDEVITLNEFKQEKNELWNAVYDSSYIESRRNYKQALRFMPKKYWNNDIKKREGDMIQFGIQETKLTQFFNPAGSV